MSQTSTQWLTFAIASGACAAINGVFAKLTTTRLTTAWANSMSSFTGLESQSAWVEYAIRACFFLMNLTFNGVMWGLFTRALTMSNSTVRVSVINTSANFMITAILGALIFGEELPGLWWLGAGLLVAGSVIIGRREELAETSTDSGGSKAADETLTAATSPKSPGDATRSGFSSSRAEADIKSRAARSETQRTRPV